MSIALDVSAWVRRSPAFSSSGTELMSTGLTALLDATLAAGIGRRFGTEWVWSKKCPDFRLGGFAGRLRIDHKALRGWRYFPAIEWYTELQGSLSEITSQKAPSGGSTVEDSPAQRLRNLAHLRTLAEGPRGAITEPLSFTASLLAKDMANAMQLPCQSSFWALRVDQLIAESYRVLSRGTNDRHITQTDQWALATLGLATLALDGTKICKLCRFRWTLPFGEHCVMHSLSVDAPGSALQRQARYQQAVRIAALRPQICPLPLTQKLIESDASKAIYVGRLLWRKHLHAEEPLMRRLAAKICASPRLMHQISACDRRLAPSKLDDFLRIKLDPLTWLPEHWEGQLNQAESWFNSEAELKSANRRQRPRTTELMAAAAEHARQHPEASQQSVANAIGVSRSTVCQWLRRGVDDPRLRPLQSLRSKRGA